MKKPANYLPFSGAKTIEGPNEINLVNDILQKSLSIPISSYVHDEFTEKYIAWIKNSVVNQLQGLDSFNVKSFSNGTSETFDKFYIQHRTKRFRIFPGEYMYHLGTWKNNWNWQYVTDSPLDKNDAVIISLPFSDTGNIHVNMQEVLDECANLGIPVLIDCAFFGLCGGIKFNLDHPAITDIAFSLSKTLPVAHYRIGMRLSRTDSDDGLSIYNKIGYINRLGPAIGLKILDTITADTNWIKWRGVQEKLCQEIRIQPSSTVAFGVDIHNKFPEYNRGGSSNRLCIAKYLPEGSIDKNLYS